MEERLELLERVPLFSDVPREVLARIAEVADESDVPAESVLTHEGRHEGYFFIVESGSVKIERGGQVVATLGTGDFFGSIALVDGGPRTATATAVAPSRLLSISNEKFRALLDDSPALQSAILQAAERNLRIIDEETAG
jgi:CRP/FNR family transcriptional regulator, cyclic AMP receptor protein